MTRSQPHKSNPNNTEIAEAASTAMNAARTVAAVATRPNRRSRRALGIFTFGNRSASAGRACAGMQSPSWKLGATKLVAARTNQLFELVTAYRCGDAQ